jgi:hypothetical protein
MLKHFQDGANQQSADIISLSWIIFMVNWMRLIAVRLCSSVISAALQVKSLLMATLGNQIRMYISQRSRTWH